MAFWRRKQRRESKSPLKDLPVRNPAQGLDEEIDRLLNGKATDYLFLMGMVGLLVWWEWLALSLQVPTASTGLHGAGGRAVRIVPGEPIGTL